MRLLSGLCAFALLLTTATAQDDQVAAINQALNNLSHEYIQCAAYFSVVVVAMENSSQPETADRYQEVSDMALEYGFAYGEVAGLFPETASSRFKIEPEKWLNALQAIPPISPFLEVTMQRHARAPWKMWMVG